MATGSVKRFLRHDKRQKAGGYEFKPGRAGVRGENIEIGGARVEASKARQSFRALVDSAANRGVRVTITRNGHPQAALVPLRDLERLEEADLALDARMLEEQSALDAADTVALEGVPRERPPRSKAAPQDALDLPLRVVIGEVLARLVTPSVLQAAAHHSAVRLLDARKGSASEDEVNEIESEIRRSLTEAVGEKWAESPTARAAISELVATQRK